jgi:hypothetical protein
VTTCVLPNMPTELRPCWVLRQSSSNSPGRSTDLIQTRIMRSMHPIEPEPELKECFLYVTSSLQDYSPNVGQCPRMSPLNRPLHASFLSATSARRTTAKAISAVHADARKPSLLRDSVPGATRGAPIFRASLVQTFAALRPLHTSDRAVPRVGNPSSCTCLPCWHGPGPRYVC